MLTNGSAIAMAGLLAAAAAQQPASNPPAKSSQRAAADPNERVCEDIIQTGSRIASRRYCGTRAQWEDRKRQDREAVEKAQLSPCVVTQTSNTGRASC
jgi:hypothetical protein